MSSRFIKFIPSEEAEFLLVNHPNAFLLLTLIAMRARRISGKADGFEIGECHIGDHEACGLSRSEYRTALKHLSLRMTIKIIENCRTRQKSTTGLTTKGTKVKLLKSDIWDINPECVDHQVNHRIATASPPHRHEQERKESKEKKEYKKESIQSIRADQPIIDIRSILLSEKKEEQIGSFKKYTVEQGIEFTLRDLRAWFKAYEWDYVVAIFEILIKEINLVRADKDKEPIRNPSGWMQRALDKNYIAINMLANYNREYSIHLQKNGWPNLTIKTRYACDNTTGKDFIFSDPNCKIIMEREYERVMGA